MLMLKFRSILLKLAMALIILVPLFFAVSALGARFGLWDWTFAFGKLTREIGPKLLMLLFGLGVLSLILALALKPRRGIWVAVFAMAFPVMGMGYAKSVSKKARSLPFIHDISTNLTTPPSFTGEILAERAATEGVNSLDYASKTDPVSKAPIAEAQAKAYPDVIAYEKDDITPSALYEKALSASKAMGWDIRLADSNAKRIEATDTTFWFGFKDDIVIVITDGKGAVLNIRSVSRVGQSDLGKNAARIRKFMAKL